MVEPSEPHQPAACQSLKNKGRSKLIAVGSVSTRNKIVRLSNTMPDFNPFYILERDFTVVTSQHCPTRLDAPKTMWRPGYENASELSARCRTLHHAIGEAARSKTIFVHYNKT